MIKRYSGRHAKELIDRKLANGWTYQHCVDKDENDWQEASEHGPTFSGFCDGELVATGGAIMHWPGRAYVWAIISDDITHAGMLWLHRQALRFLRELQTDEAYRRLETIVESNFREGIRWAEMLGFVQEGLMRKYDALGSDYIMYARIV